MTLTLKNLRRARVAIGAFCSLACLLSLPVRLPAGEIEAELRNFTILINGKEQGKCSMRMSRRDDNSEVMFNEASVRMNYVVYTYDYSSRGWEIWKEGRLQHLKNAATFNGTKYAIEGVAKGKNLQLKVNGEQRPLDPLIWPTSYWRQPDPKQHNQEVLLLDPDKGEERTGTLHWVGHEELTVVGKPQKCAHLQIKGKIPVELWYDSRSRLVRQESLESGHRIIMHLSRIIDDSKNPPAQTTLNTRP